MGIFDSFKSDSAYSEIDLSDIKFISNDHIRFQNGQDVSGHNLECWRGIRIQKSISDGKGFTVTIFNLDGNHNLWGDNIQMAPKQMEIIDQNHSMIKLRGYGTDSMGNSFSDYGLTLHLSNEVIEKVTLQMFDRNIDITYFKAMGSFEKQTAAKKDDIPVPSTDIFEIMALSEIIHKSQDLSVLNHIYSQKGDYNHPQIQYDFGVAYLVRGDRVNAKNALIKGAIYGLKYPCSLYSHVLVDSIGQCLSILMTQFPSKNDEVTLKKTALAYVYLSRCIELAPRQAQDSYRTRALLFKDHENPNIVQRFILNTLGLGVLVEPFIISDFYFASQAKGSPHQDALQSAMRIHQRLDDIAIGGRDADDYTLEELAEFGERRHLAFFKKLEQQYMKGELDLTIVDFRQSCE